MQSKFLKILQVSSIKVVLVLDDSGKFHSLFNWFLSGINGLWRSEFFSENARTLFCEALGILGFFIFWCELIQMPPFKFFYTTVLVGVCVRRWEYSKTEGFYETDFRKKLFVDAFVYFCGEWFWCHHIIAPHKASKQAALGSKLGPWISVVQKLGSTKEDLGVTKSFQLSSSLKWMMKL